MFASCSSYVRIFFQTRVFFHWKLHYPVRSSRREMFWKFCPRICGKLGTLILALTGVIKSRAGIPVKTFLVTERNKQTKKELTRNVTPNITDNLYFQNVNKINSAYAEPSSPSGRRLAPVSLYNLRSIFFSPGGSSFSRREKITNVWFAVSVAWID